MNEQAFSWSKAQQSTEAVLLSKARLARRRLNSSWIEEGPETAAGCALFVTQRLVFGSQMVVVQLARLLCCATACNASLWCGKSEKHFDGWELEAHDLKPRASWAGLGAAVVGRYLSAAGLEAARQRHCGSWSWFGMGGSEPAQ